MVQKDSRNFRCLFTCILVIVLSLALTACARQQGDGNSDSTTPKQDSLPLTVTNLAVGHGDCAVLRKEDTFAMIDAGPAEARDVVFDYLEKEGITELSFVIFTHFDKDHIGNAVELLRTVKVGTVYIPGYVSEKDLYQGLMNELEEVSVQIISSKTDFSWDLVDITIYPAEDAEEILSDKDNRDNNMSLVTLVTHGADRLLFTGDIEKDRIESLLDSGVGIQADWIKLPHHGRFNKKLDSLLETVSPEFVVVSGSGEEDDFEKTEELLRETGVKVYRTSEGTVVTISSGEGITVEQLMSVDTKVQPDEADEETTSFPSRFSLLEEGCSTPVKCQDGGTCWVNAAATSMESSYKLLHGEDITIDAMEILDRVLGNDKAEGYFLDKGYDAKNIGGWAWQITETLSNGFGDYTLVEAIDYNDADRAAIKEAIIQNGGMNIAVNDNNSLYGSFEGFKTYNSGDSTYFDHEVVLVGWDDSFPKENFKKEAKEDGAWIAQNTRGETWGNDGCYMLSYDSLFSERTIFKMSDEYSKVLSYDGGNAGTIQTDDSTSVANIFREEGSIRSVGTYTCSPDQKVKVEILTEDFSEVLYTDEVTFADKGYHAIELGENLEVSEFAVALTFEGAAPVEGESWSDVGVRYEAGIEDGQSFVLIDGIWCDLAEESTIASLGVDFIPGNCCIKVLYE